MSNVIKLGEVKKNRPTTTPTDKGDYSFEEVIKQNKQRQQRLKRDRDTANDKVKRSHRLDR